MGVRQLAMLVRRLIVLFLAGTSVFAAKYHVMVGGLDDPSRDGLSWETAWASLAFGCEQVPDMGEHKILIRAGTYEATRTAYPKSGTTISGESAHGKMRTRLVASESWQVSPTFQSDAPPIAEHLIGLRKVKNVRIQNLSLISPPDHRLTGGIAVYNCEDVVIERLSLRDFRWNGILLAHSSQVKLGHCELVDCSTDKVGHHGGHIRTRWLRDSEIYHNRVTGRTGGGYGYKAGGHRKVRIHHNVFDIRNGFSFESAHENEFEVEVDHNWMNHCISIPKGRQAADPTREGYPYSFWIHHNILRHSYTIEGPRNHLIFEHNHVHIDHINGRVYTHHGGINEGPVTIRYNLIENVDRALIWMNEGKAEGISVYNNSVVLADAGTRTGTILGAYTAERFDRWTFKNNLVVAAWSQPRRLHPDRPNFSKQIDATHNLFLDVSGVPDGNIVDTAPGIVRSGSKPSPFYFPASETSPLVDAGVDMGQPFHGQAPDIGAFEFGVEPWSLEGVPRPR